MLWVKLSAFDNWVQLDAGMVWYWMVLDGTGWYCMVLHGTAWYSRAQLTMELLARAPATGHQAAGLIAALNAAFVTPKILVHCSEDPT